VPIYEYLCGDCGKVNEAFQKVNDPPPARCDGCGGRRLSKLVSRSAFQLKGGGWYSDLYASARKEAPAAGDGAPAPAAPGTGAATPPPTAPGAAASAPEAPSKGGSAPEAPSKGASAAKAGSPPRRGRRGGPSSAA
jgi:putative FmdB family regulatory protein